MFAVQGKYLARVEKSLSDIAQEKPLCRPEYYGLLSCLDTEITFTKRDESYFFMPDVVLVHDTNDCLILEYQGKHEGSYLVTLYGLRPTSGYSTYPAHTCGLRYIYPFGEDLVLQFLENATKTLPHIVQIVYTRDDGPIYEHLSKIELLPKLLPTVRDVVPNVRRKFLAIGQQAREIYWEAKSWVTKLVNEASTMYLGRFVREEFIPPYYINRFEEAKIRVHLEKRPKTWYFTVLPEIVDEKIRKFIPLAQSILLENKVTSSSLLCIVARVVLREAVDEEIKKYMM